VVHECDRQTDGITMAITACNGAHLNVESFIESEFMHQSIITTQNIIRNIVTHNKMCLRALSSIFDSICLLAFYLSEQC